jgi:alcohol dehydrogenase
MKFNFHMPTRVIFEEALTKDLKRIVRGSHLLMMCDPFLYKNGTAQKIAESTQMGNITYFCDIEPNPSFRTIDKATEFARQFGADVVIGLGGGSVMDASKMVACLIENEGNICDYYRDNGKKIMSRGVKLICIPTTSGTGSEVTNIGVYTNTDTGIKMPFASDYFWPDIAIIDPELTYTLPMNVTASTGMDAFCHAIEAYWSINSNPVSDSISLSVLKNIIENIETACFEPINATARRNMAYASMMAGISFSQTKTTAIHAVSFPLTSDFGASHGLACSITLPAFIKFAYDGCKSKMDYMLTILGYNSIDNFANEIEKLLQRIGLPTTLGELNITEDDLGHIVDVSMKAPLIAFSPVKLDNENLYKLLKSIL